MERTAESTFVYRCRYDLRNGEPVSEGCVNIEEVPGNFEEVARQRHGGQVTVLDAIQGTRLAISHPQGTASGFEYYLYRPVLK